MGLLTLLVLAVSIDGFSAGFSFGLRRLVIPLYSLLIICLFSSLAAVFSMLIGSRVAMLIPVSWLPSVGGAILIILGVYIIISDFRKSRQPALPEWEREEVDAENGSSLRILTSISKCPDKADLDCSGKLSAGEAALLGLVLSADVFGAGIGASLIGLPIFLTAMAVGAAQLLLIPLGAGCGRLMSGLVSLKMTSLWAGFILIFVGLINML
ncbi:MAG TPA: sporulation membrane protein YtaF [Firmicutes bacterium]|nr:sporulation membrane protein YtaF [Bacillota bacterium]